MASLHPNKKRGGRLGKKVRYTSFHLSVETMHSLEGRAIRTNLCASMLDEGYLPFSIALSPLASWELSRGKVLGGRAAWITLKIAIIIATAVIEHITILKGLDSSWKVWKGGATVSTSSRDILESWLLPPCSSKLAEHLHVLVLH